MSIHATISNEHLYWAIVDTVPGGRLLRPGEIASLAEDVLPLAIESLHIVSVRTRDGRSVVCAIEPEDLRAAALDCNSATPESIPDFIQARLDEPLDAARFDLLVGAFEPADVRRVRRMMLATLAVTAALITIAVAAGFIARGIAARRAIDIVDDRRSDIVRAAVGQPGVGIPGAPPSVSALPGDLRLVAELRELRSTRAVSLPRLEDVSDLASAALERWPPDAEARLERARISSRSISIEGWASDAGEAQRIADALGTLPGARLEPPQVRAAKEGVTFTIILPPGPPAPGTGTPAPPGPAASAPTNTVDRGEEQ